MDSTMRVDVRTAATRHGHCVLVKCDRYATADRQVMQYGLTDECIERIADAVVKKLRGI